MHNPSHQKMPNSIPLNFQKKSKKKKKTKPKTFWSETKEKFQLWIA